jgi:hypothetical protein
MALTTTPAQASRDDLWLVFVGDKLPTINHGVYAIGPMKKEVSLEGKLYDVVYYVVHVEVRCFADGDLTSAVWLDNTTLELTMPNFASHIKEYLTGVSNLLYADEQGRKAYRTMFMAMEGNVKKCQLIFKKPMVMAPPSHDFPLMRVPDKAAKLCNTCKIKPAGDTVREVMFMVEEVDKTATGEDIVTAISESVRFLDLG